MSKQPGRERDFSCIQQDWQAVGGYLSAAVREIALEIDGEELAAEVVSLATSTDILPSPGILKLLEDLHPGSAELVMARATEIQKDAHERNNEEIRSFSVRKYGKAALNAFSSFTIHGNRQPRR